MLEMSASACAPMVTMATTVKLRVTGVSHLLVVMEALVLTMESSYSASALQGLQENTVKTVSEKWCIAYIDFTKKETTVH